MSSILKGIIDEGEEVAVIYIDNKPSTKYAKKHEAERDAEFLRKKYPDKKIEIKHEVRETEAKKGADGKRCWKGKRYAGTENGKDKCVPVKNEAANPAQQAAIAVNMKKQGKKPKNEGVIIGHDATDPDVAVLGGAGSYKLSNLKKKAQMEASQLAKDISEGKFKNSAYNVKQLTNTLNTIVAAEEEMEKNYFGEGIKDTLKKSALGLGAAAALASSPAVAQSVSQPQQSQQQSPRSDLSQYSIKKLRFGMTPDEVGSITGKIEYDIDKVRADKQKLFMKHQEENLSAHRETNKRLEQLAGGDSEKFLQAMRDRNAAEIKWRDDECQKELDRLEKIEFAIKHRDFSVEIPSKYMKQSKDFDYLLDGYSIAGYPFWKALEENGKLVSLYMNLHPEADVPDTVKVFTNVYGKPSVRTQPVQTRMGYRATNVIYTWKVKDVTITLRKYAGRIDQGEISIDWDKADQMRTSQRNTDVANATKDFEESYTGEFAAEKTPAINPYGGLKDKQHRGDIDEARAPHPLLKAVNKNLVDLASGEVRRREEQRRAAEKGQKAASKYLKGLDKKPSTDEVWRKIEDAVANSFPDGDPYDMLWPWLERNGLDNDDVVRAARKQGYKDLWDYWHILSRDIGHEVMNEMPDTSGPVGTQPGGWRKYKQKGAGITESYPSNVKQYAKDLASEMREEGYDWEPVDLSDPEEAIDDAREQLSMFASSNMCDFFGDYDTAEQLQIIKMFNKKFGGVKEDTAYAGGMGQGGNAGESYRKFKPKSAGTYKESSIMKGLKR